MSSRRERSGGSSMRITLRRWNRSSRNRPACHAILEVLVRGGDHAHIDLDRRLAADAIELALGQHAQQARLQRRVDMSPISSRNSVPPSACSKRPRRSESAPVNEPFSWPNSSDSSSSPESPRYSAR
jgi:hypothetical protein